MNWLKRNSGKVAFFAICFFLPTALRKKAYKWAFGYEFSPSAALSRFTLVTAQKLVMRQNSKIGPFNLIDSKVVILDRGAEIRSRNILINLAYTKLHEQATIVTANKFVGPRRLNVHTNFDSSLELGNDSAITFGHYFDLFESIVFGDNVVVGGIGSQFWTHGFNNMRQRISGSIEVGDWCYFGSRILVNPNVNICDNVTVGGGSVVHKSIGSSGLYVSNSLIKK